MAAIPINLTIPANKNLNDEALNAFIRAQPNDTANPDSRFFVPADPPTKPLPGIDDEDWLRLFVKTCLNDAIDEGRRLLDFEQNYQSPPADPDIVEIN